MTPRPPRALRSRTRNWTAGHRRSWAQRGRCTGRSDLGISSRSTSKRSAITDRRRYKGQVVGHGQLDLLIRDRLVVELKAVEVLASIHALQLRSYLKALISGSD